MRTQLAPTQNLARKSNFIPTRCDAGENAGTGTIFPWTTSLGPGGPIAWTLFDKAQVNAMACEVVRETEEPLSRQSVDSLARRAQRILTKPISRTTVWTWLNEAAIKPWQYEHWIYPRLEGFAERAGPILDIYEGLWQKEPLREGDFVICADEKTSIQARKRTHPGQPPAPGRKRRVEYEYERKGALQYLAAWDVQQGLAFGRTEEKNGIDPFMRLVNQVMSQEP